jgi:hypothetical protein
LAVAERLNGGPAVAGLSLCRGGRTSARSRYRGDRCAIHKSKALCRHKGTLVPRRAGRKIQSRITPMTISRARARPMPTSPQASASLRVSSSHMTTQSESRAFISPYPPSRKPVSRAPCKPNPQVAPVALWSWRLNHTDFCRRTRTHFAGLRVAKEAKATELPAEVSPRPSHSPPSPSTSSSLTGQTT